MAVSNTKYSAPRHTPGGELLLNGKDYRGWFIVTHRDEYFTGKEVTTASSKLTPINTEAPINAPIFIEQVVEPSTYDRSNGTWTRFFIQKNSNLRVIEVTQLRFNSFKNVTGYKLGELKWKLKGPADNQSINGYTYFGATHINKINTEALNSNLPGITSYIKNYSEFVE